MRPLFIPVQRFPFSSCFHLRRFIRATYDTQVQCTRDICICIRAAPCIPHANSSYLPDFSSRGSEEPRLARGRRRIRAGGGMEKDGGIGVSRRSFRFPPILESPSTRRYVTRASLTGRPESRPLALHREESPSPQSRRQHPKLFRPCARN